MARRRHPTPSSSQSDQLSSRRREADGMSSSGLIRYERKPDKAAVKHNPSRPIDDAAYVCDPHASIAPPLREKRKASVHGLTPRRGKRTGRKTAPPRSVARKKPVADR
ncbi:hypothetical protein HPB50_000054 [Hyalomma asiaticum]|uniref:Uncharacterized protein n=1 Tax=Hyalomma asiaticum TaxID=266040 RepID=A0ACB7STL0_HYAAI|nr:hypothetical protein HPB50_000054 [Hyalomma asiaticum]